MRGGVVPIGLLLLTAPTFENSLTSTVAYAEDFAQWTLWFETPLLLVSVVARFLAAAGLFLLVYPLLPRLIVSLPQPVIGRAVYSLSVAALIGFYLGSPLRWPAWPRGGARRSFARAAYAPGHEVVRRPTPVLN
jgi:hypothetical protein